VYKSVQNFLKNNKLISNAGVYIIGNMLQKALSFFLIPVYTRFLTPDDYGITGVATAVGSVLMIILGFGISSSVARHYFDYTDNPENQKSYITSTFIALIVGAGIITLLLNSFGDTIWGWMMGGNVPFSPYIRIVLWSGYAELLTQIPLTLYRTQQKARAFMIGQIGNFLLTLFFTILFVVVMRMGAKGVLLGSMVASAITAMILAVLLLRKWFSIHFNFSYVWIALVFGLPLVPHSLSAWIMVSVDRLLLESRVSLSELGLYNLGYQIGQVMMVLVTSINFAWSPYYYNLVKTDANATRRISQVSALYIAIMGAICLIGILFSPELLYIIAPRQYQMAARYVPLILFSYLFNGYYFFASMPLFYFKKTYLIPIATTVSAVLNILLNIWWIPMWGALGSAWATMVVYIMMAAVAYILGRRWQKVDFHLNLFFVINLIIFIGVILTTYGLGLSTILLVLIKISLLVIFSLVAYFGLVKPNIRKFIH
jgi:O-antigen/teichoic acid export membrane protein